MPSEVLTWGFNYLLFMFSYLYYKVYVFVNYKIVVLQK